MRVASVSDGKTARVKVFELMYRNPKSVGERVEEKKPPERKKEKKMCQEERCTTYACSSKNMTYCTKHSMKTGKICVSCHLKKGRHKGVFVIFTMVIMGRGVVRTAAVWNALATPCRWVG